MHKLLRLKVHAPAPDVYVRVKHCSVAEGTYASPEQEQTLQSLHTALFLGTTRMQLHRLCANILIPQLKVEASICLIILGPSIASS